jgi:hypothetical protein
MNRRRVHAIIRQICIRLHKLTEAVTVNSDTNESFINNELKYPALLGIEDKVNCYIPTASTM